MTQPALHLVNSDGEIAEDAPSYSQALGMLQAKDDEIAGLERDIRGWRTRYANLARDVEAQARAHENWPAVEALFDYWRRKCNHPRSKFGAEEFNLAEPLWREYGDEVCRKAIDGAAFDPYKTQLRNGSTKRHDGFVLIFKSRGKLEDFANRAPRAEK